MSEARHYLTEVCHAAEVEENVDDIYTGEAPAKSDLIGHIFAPVRFLQLLTFLSRSLTTTVYPRINIILN